MRMSRMMAIMSQTKNEFINNWIDITSSDTFGYSGVACSLCDFDGALAFARVVSQPDMSNTRSYSNGGWSSTGSYLPSAPPSGTAYSCSLCEHDGALYLAIGHNNSYYSYVSIWRKATATGDWTILTPPQTNFPPTNVRGCKLISHNGILSMITANNSTSPRASLYTVTTTNWSRRNNLTAVNTGTALSCSLHSFDGGLYYAVGTNASPYLYTGQNIPTIHTTVNGCTVYAYDNTLYMATAHSTSPFIVVYYLSGSTWIQMTNLPELAVAATECEFCTYKDVLYLAVSGVSPYITTYYLKDNVWVKIPDPTNLPNSTGQSCALCVSGGNLYLAVANTLSSGSSFKVYRGS